MESEKIKVAVTQVNLITATRDFNFAQDEVRNRATSLLVHLTNNFGKSPVLAAAIVQKLVDEGYRIGSLKGDAVTSFQSKFGNRLHQLKPHEMDNVKKIGESLFH